MQPKELTHIYKLSARTKKRNSRTVIQMDSSTGQVLGEFMSAKEASLSMGKYQYAVSHAIGLGVRCAGFRWAYAIKSPNNA